MINLSDNIAQINQVGATTAKRLKKLGLNTVEDLLFYFPFRYDDFSKQTPINKLKGGEIASVSGQIELIQNKRSPQRRIYITEAFLRDQSGQIKIIWFNQPFIGKNLKPGDKISLVGKIEDDRYDLILKSPIYEKIYNNTIAIHTQGLISNYHLTAGLTQKQIRFLIKQIIPLTEKIIDWLPEQIKKRNNLFNLSQAISQIHFPKNKINLSRARERLSFDELFLIQLNSQIIKQSLLSSQAEAIIFFEKETKKFVKNLPFSLTNDQKKSAWQILQDITNNKPMSRILAGDVGSGKTIVAIMAMLNIALNNKQSVLMAPTEILAEQHYETINKFLKKFNIKIGLITGSQKKLNQKIKNKKNSPIAKISKAEIAKQAQIVIGTHALLQKKINFNNLALAIIDEQHRFGVEQRKTLIEKSGNPKTIPHFLSLTATPIPRTLSLALYGDLKISYIKEKPIGRKQIITKIVEEKKRPQAYEFIRTEISKGRQAFIICPLIDPSDKLGVKSVKEEYKKLNEKIFPKENIALLHGRLKPKEKEKIMADFSNKKIKIIISTSVIEVGIDIPNANIMVIEDAERFGLAQLHQFRGRVGRGEHQSYCFLFTKQQTNKTKNRLKAMEKYDDGLELAEIDLKLRGPGEVYGTTQKGFSKLKIATLFDYELIKKAQNEAQMLIKKNPKLNKEKLLKEKLDTLNKFTNLD